MGNHKPGAGGDQDPVGSGPLEPWSVQALLWGRTPPEGTVLGAAGCGRRLVLREGSAGWGGRVGRTGGAVAGRVQQVCLCKTGGGGRADNRWAERPGTDLGGRQRRPLARLVLCLRPAFPAEAPPLGAPCPLSPPRLPRGGRVEGLGGGRVPPCHRLRRRSSPVAAPPPARCPRRVSGRGGAAAGPRGAFPGSGPPLPGGPRSLGSRGAPAVVRRVPPPALDGSLSVRRMSARTSALPLRVLSSPTAPQASGPGPAPLLSFRASVPPSSRALARSCPASRRSPPPRPPWREGGLGRGCGEGRGGGVGGLGGVLEGERGSGPPRRLWVGGVASSGGGGGPVAAPGGPSSVTGRQRRGLLPCGWLFGRGRGSASRRWPGASSPPLPRLSPTPCPGT